MADIFQMAEMQSQTGRNPTVKQMWCVRGLFDEPDVRALVLATVPAMYETLMLVSTTQDHLGGSTWSCSVNYGIENERFNPIASGAGEGSDDGQGSESGGDPIGLHTRVSIGAKQQHITQSLRTVVSEKKTADTRAVPNHKGAIGVSKDGIEGCDIIVPELKWSETWTFLSGSITWQYIRVMSGMVGRTNKNVFRSFPRSNVMFLGCEIDAKDNEKTQAVFSFHASPNVDVKLDGFATFEKRGHQYLWIEYEDSASADGINKVPRAAFVEEVGRDGLLDDSSNPTNEVDFKYLEIGS